ncbi:hypothetical protein TPDSL_17750 [Terrisporobacter petrolearius]|uniref:hypothetical protein n=1 Tax=Terrisporobacter petrolearius TaxID=1460447 RepID=UPI003369218B
MALEYNNLILEGLVINKNELIKNKRRLQLEIENLCDTRYDLDKKYYCFNEVRAIASNNINDSLECLLNLIEGSSETVSYEIYDLNEKCKKFNFKNNLNEVERLFDELALENDYVTFNMLDEEQKKIAVFSLVKFVNEIDFDKSDANYNQYLKSIDEKLEVIENEIKSIDNKLEHYRKIYLQDLYDVAISELSERCFDSRYLFSQLDLNLNWSYFEKEGVTGRFRFKEYKIDIDKNYIFLDEYDIESENSRDIILTLKHEIMHAYVSKFYGDEYSFDTNPFFMSTLLWASPDEKNSYECFEKFKQTEAYEKIMRCKTFNDAESLAYEMFIENKLEVI